MIRPEDFVQLLEEQGFRNYTGVPCSFFQSIICYLEDQDNLNYYLVPNEGSALALASGSYLAGNPCVVMIQNSGLGNLINPLTSLNEIYKIPALIFISGRAYGISDEPQHEIMGKKMGKLLESLDIPYWDLPQDASWKDSIEQGVRKMNERKRPVVFFVRKNSFENYKNTKSNSENHFEMKRYDAISLIKDRIPKDALIFATTGMPSRELFSSGDRPGNFYMQGSMGHIGSIALGMALSRPEQQVVILDGDGAFLMHMGTVSSIGYYQPKNLIHLVLDNEAYETTGAQATTSGTTDFEKIAKACGYKHTAGASSRESLNRELQTLMTREGPSLLRIKINSQETKDIPRISTKYSSDQITENFVQHSANKNLAGKTN